VITGALVGGAGLAAWTFLPQLQAPATVVSREAEEGSERARRLLDQYDAVADSAQTAAARAGMDEGLTDERIRELVEEDTRKVQDVLEEEARRINDMLKSAVSRLRQHDQKFADLGGDSSAGQLGSVRFGNNANAMAKSMSDGLKGSETATRRNSSILKRAANVAGDALKATAGDASGSDSFVANRMRGVTLFHQGLSFDRKARLARAEADSVLAALAQVQLQVGTLKGESKIVKSSGIEGAISKQQTQLADAESAHKAILESVSTLESKVEVTKRQIDEQSTLATGLRDQLDALESRGVQYEGSNPGDDFSREYSSLAAKYRAALRLGQELRQGTISGAHLEAGGELVSGRYVPDRDGEAIQYEPGLDELERRLVKLGWEQTGTKQILEDETAALDRLNDIKQSHTAKAEVATTALSAKTQQAEALLEDFQRLFAEVASLEDEAIGSLELAQRSFSAAKRAAQARMSDLPDLPQEKEALSTGKLIKEDRWLVGQMASQSADSGTRAAMVLYDRYTHLAKAIVVFESMESAVTNVDLKIDEMKELRASTKKKAESLLDDAIDGFEGAARGFKSHWSVAASLAGADYMLALFDHPELVGAAIANYQSVVKDRETQSHVRPFAKRLKQLRNR